MRAGDFFAVDLPVDFFAADEDFLAGADLVVLFFAVDDFVAVEAFFAGADFFAVDVFLAGADFAVLFFAVDLLADDFAAPVAFFAAPAADRVVVPDADRAAEAAAFGSFLAPLTTSLNPWPALNFGTEVFLILTDSPVRGLRPVRAGRATFSKTPKPEIATFSPDATARVMVSTTTSTASLATFLLPSWPDTFSIS